MIEAVFPGLFIVHHLIFIRCLLLWQQPYTLKDFFVCFLLNPEAEAAEGATVRGT